MILKKTILALFGIAFALAITSCNEQKKTAAVQKPADKEHKAHSRKW